MNAQHLANHIMALKKYKQEILSEYMNTSKGSELEKVYKTKIEQIDFEIGSTTLLLSRHMNI